MLKTIPTVAIPIGNKEVATVLSTLIVGEDYSGEDGNQGRCFIYIEDLAEGNVAALTESAKNEIINLAGLEFVTMNQIAEALKQIFGDVEITYEAARPHDFEGSVTNIDKAKKLLKWHPKTLFKDGIRKYVEYVESVSS